MAERAPRLARIDEVEPAAWGPFGTAGPMDGAPFVSSIADFYRTDPISRASGTMDECAAAFAEDAGKTGTDG